MKLFESKDFLETAYITFDFKDDIVMSSILSAETAVQTITGESAPESLIIEATYIHDDYVVLRVSGGVQYNSYKLRCVVLTSHNDEFVIEGILPIPGYSSQYTHSVVS